MRTVHKAPRCRVEPDHLALLSYLQANNYPVQWTPDMLVDCIVVRIFDDTGTIGYCWGHWLFPRTLAFHVCAARPRWVRALPELFQIAFWLGADDLVASLDGHSQPSRLRSLLLRAGFMEEPVSFFTKSLLDEHELPPTQATVSPNP